MKTTFGMVVLACVAGSMLVAAQPAGAKGKDKPAAQESQSAKIAENEGQQVAYLGVGVQALHPAFWAHLRDVLEHKQGLLVVQVAEGSPAEEAGIKVDDILMTFDDQKLFSPGQLAALVQSDKTGHAVKLGVLRDGKPQEVSVTLGEYAMRTTPPAIPRTDWRPRWFTSRMTPPTTEGDSHWKTFDSLTLKSLGNDRYKAEIGYEAENGKIENRTFEGTREEIRKDVLQQNDLPAAEREHLLRALDLPSVEIPLEFPGVFFTPNGRVMWDFGDADNASWPFLSGAF